MQTNYCEIGDGYLSHHNLSTFVTGCDVLSGMDVALAAYGGEPARRELTLESFADEKIWPQYYKFLSAQEIRARLKDGAPATSPSTVEILSAYLSVMCDLGGFYGG